MGANDNMIRRQAWNQRSAAAAIFLKFADPVNYLPPRIEGDTDADGWRQGRKGSVLVADPIAAGSHSISILLSTARLDQGGMSPSIVSNDHQRAPPPSSGEDVNKTEV